jgi:hypothetical protein
LDANVVQVGSALSDGTPRCRLLDTTPLRSKTSTICGSCSFAGQSYTTDLGDDCSECWFAELPQIVPPEECFRGGDGSIAIRLGVDQLSHVIGQCALSRAKVWRFLRLPLQGPRSRPG